jgi:competence ComEA-like helix-hairpin-helix protein
LKLTPPEAKAVKFVLFLICLSALARWLNRSGPVAIEQNVQGSATEVLNSEARQGPPARLDPNRASAEELEKLPGIGPAAAQKIIAARPLRTVDDLALVIGKKRAERLLPRLTPLKRTTSHNSELRNSLQNAKQPVAPQLSASRIINLNRASASELEQLPGVGPALAQRLIAARDSLRVFRDWSQIDAVQGVGPALLKKLKNAASL